jgi:D-arginine dehydrogenase
MSGAALAADVMVIGAGIAGASAAYHLAGEFRVVVLEREDVPGYHTTGRSAASFTENYGNDTIRKLTRASRDFFESPPVGFATHPLLAPRSIVTIARSDQLEALELAFQRARETSPTVRRLTVDEVVRGVPIIRREYLSAGFFDAACRDIDVHAVHHGFLRGARARGCQLVCNAEIIGLAMNGGLWHAETRAGPVTARFVVNAAGAWCDKIAELADARPIQLVPKRRTAVTIDVPVDVSGWPMVEDANEGFYFKPEAGRILASPGDETPMEPCDVQPDELDVAVTIDRLERATILSIRRISHRWAGLRSFVADRTPVVGFDPARSGFFWLAGQGGYGIATSPALGRTTASLIANGRLPADLVDLGLHPRDLAPERLGGGSPGRANAD